MLKLCCEEGDDEKSELSLWPQKGLERPQEIEHDGIKKKKKKKRQDDARVSRATILYFNEQLPSLLLLFSLLGADHQGILADQALPPQSAREGGKGKKKRYMWSVRY